MAEYQPLPHSEDVVTLAQKDRERAVVIRHMGKNVVQLLGSGDWVGQKVNRLFPQRIIEILDEQVSFSPEGEDVGDVLRKIRRVTVLTGDGREIPVLVKIQPEGVEGTDMLYAVRLRPDTPARPDHRILARQMAVRENQTFDQETRLPDQLTFVKDLETVHRFVAREGAQATVTLVQIEPIESAWQRKALLGVIEACRAVFRSEDTLARYAPEALGVILMDAPKANAPVAYNRLRMAIKDYLGPLGLPQMPKIHILYDAVRPSETPDALLKRLDKALKTYQPEDDGAQIIDLGGK